MTDQKRKRMMFALLIGSVLFGLYMKPWERRIKTVTAIQSDAAPAAVEVETAAFETQTASFELVADWPARDPFSRPGEFTSQQSVVTTEEVSPGVPPFVVQGIMTVDGQMVCVVDGQVCRIGSQVSGWRVDRIDAQGAWVSQGGERHFVPLP